MLRSFLTAGIVLVALVAICLAEDAPPPASGNPDELIGLLEKGDFDQRQDAVKQLEALGDKARQALEKAAQRSETLDVRQTAERLLDRLSGARLRIELFDTKGKRVPGVPLEVKVQRQPQVYDPMQWQLDREKPAVSVTSGDDGCAVVDHLTPGPANISILRKGIAGRLGIQWSTSLFLRPGENHMHYPLQNGGTLTGAVASAADGKPLAGATVVVVPDVGQDPRFLDLDKTWLRAAEGESELKATSDAAGTFTLERVPEESYLVFARHEDYVTGGGTPIRIHEGNRSVVPAEIRLAPRAACGSIAGVLLDDKGQPRKNAAFQVVLARLPQGPDAAAELAALKAWLENSANNSREHDEPLSATTGEDGRYELKDVAPGTYRMVARQASEDNEKVSKYLWENVVVAAGKATAVAGQKPAECGRISGEIVDPGSGPSWRLGVWALSAANPETAVVASDLRRHAGWFNTWSNDPDFKASVEDGKFELTQLLPGRYTLVVWRNQDLAAVIHGVESVAGKATRIAGLKLNGVEVPEMKGGIGGVVLLPDGKPAEGARVALRCAGDSSNQTMCENRGTFSFGDHNLDGPPTQLIARLQGYRPTCLDLSVPGTPLSNLTLQLVKQTYGSVAVTVVDAAGHPLKGAVVAARAGTSVYQINSARQIATTDMAGRAVLKGLACAKRGVEVVRDGYYLPRLLEVDVKPDAVTPVTVTLQPGLTLKGAVEVPAGRDFSTVLVTLHNGVSGGHALLAGVDAAGRFSFAGLVPGKVMLFAAGPGLVTASGDTESSCVELNEKTPAVALKLVAAGGLKAEFGTAKKGWRVALLDEGSWDCGRAPKPVDAAEWPFGGIVDSLGQVELDGVRPGNHDLLLQAPAGPGNDEMRGNVAAAMLVCPRVTVAVCAADEVGKLQPVKLSVLAGSGQVAGRLALKSMAGWRPGERSVGMLRLMLVGERAVASTAFSLPEELDPRNAPLMSGQAPEGFHLPQPGEFAVSGLPAGDYRLYLEYIVHEQNGTSWDAKTVEACTGSGVAAANGTRPARTFRVENGQTVKLDQITLDVPPAVVERMRVFNQSQQDWQTPSDLGDDEGPEFQP